MKQQFSSLQKLMDANGVILRFKATCPKVLYIKIKQYQEIYGVKCFQIAKIGALYYAYIIEE